MAIMEKCHLLNSVGDQGILGSLSFFISRVRLISLFSLPENRFLDNFVLKINTRPHVFLLFLFMYHFIPVCLNFVHATKLMLSH